MTATYASIALLAVLCALVARLDHRRTRRIVRRHLDTASAAEQEASLMLAVGYSMEPYLWLAQRERWRAWALRRKL